MSDEPPSVTEARPDLPEALDAVIQKAMAKEPEVRHKTAVEMIHDAELAFDRKTRAAIQPPGPLESAQETGIRPPEGQVDTRQTRAQGSDELAAATRLGGPGATLPGVQPDATRIGVPGDATQLGGAPTPVRRRPDGDRRGSRGGRHRHAAARRDARPRHLDPRRAAARLCARRRRRARRPPSSSSSCSPRSRPPSAASSPAIRARRPPPRRRPRAAARRRPGRSRSPTRSPGSGSTPAPAGRRDRRRCPASTSRTRSRPGPAGAASQGRITAGLVDATGASLLPAGFVKALGAEPDRSDTVKLGDYAAYRYKGLQPAGFAPDLTIYAVPTDKGVATIACQSDATASATFMPLCEQAASSLKLTGAKPFPLGASKEYTDALNATLAKLKTDQAAGTKALKAAKTPAQQAKAATQLQNAYKTAAASLAEADGVAADQGSERRGRRRAEQRGGGAGARSPAGRRRPTGARTWRAAERSRRRRRNSPPRSTR